MNTRKIYLKNNIIGNIVIMLLPILTGLVAFKISDQAKIIFNEAIMKNNLSMFEENIITFILLYISLFALSVIKSILRSYVQWKGNKNLAMFSVDKLLKTDYDYFIKNNSASMWTDINSSSSGTGSYYSLLVDTLSSFIEFIIYTFIIFNINFYAGIFSILSIPLIYLLTIGVNKKIITSQEKMLESSRGLSSLSVEMFSTIANIKAKSEYIFFKSKLDKRYTNLNNAVVKSNFFITYWQSITDMINSIVPILVLYLIMKFTSIIKITSGDIIVLYSFIPMFLASFKRTYSSLMYYYTSKPHLKNIKRFIDLPEESTGTVIVNEFKSLETNELKLDNHGKIVEIPNIKIAEGEKILIMGESGIGKSTLFNIMLGLRKDYTGNIKINGYDLKDINIDSLRKVIGISFQGNSVFSLTLKENIILGSEELLDIDKIIQVSELEKLIVEKGDNILNTKNLSGGEQSRISIAQNLVRNPDVILIDESLSSVDEMMESQIIKNIMSNFKDKTIICISHRKSTREYFDKLIQFSPASASAEVL